MEKNVPTAISAAKTAVTLSFLLALSVRGVSWVVSFASGIETGPSIGLRAVADAYKSLNKWLMTCTPRTSSWLKDFSRQCVIS